MQKIVKSIILATTVLFGCCSHSWAIPTGRNVNQNTYTPILAPSIDYIKVFKETINLASWYNAHGKGLRTASGICHTFSIAHRSLPFGTKVRLTNVSNGKSVYPVYVDDRGPAKWTGRSVDVSKEVAVALGFIDQGTAKLKMEILR